MMGISEDYFWRSNPDKLEPYFTAFQQKQFETDRLLHRMGSYVYEAMGSALSGFGKRPHAYRDKPYSAEEKERIEIERMTEEERMEKVEDIFKMLCSNEDKVVNMHG